jgi:hypothetical protein
MTCRELNLLNISADSVKMERFDHLQPKSKDVLVLWFREAWKMRELEPEKHAEAFLMAWNALIGWAECVSGEEDSTRALAAVAVSTEVNDRYNRIFENKKSLFRMYAKRFATLWPVFGAAELAKKGIIQTEYLSRTDLAKEYFANGAEICGPACWKRHQDAGEEIPVDLAHLLAALSQLRRSFFQGRDEGHSEVNHHLISTGYLAMAYYLKENGIYILETTINRDLFGAELIY